MIAWAVLWGPIPTLLPRWRTTSVLTTLAIVDLWTMPLLPEVALGQ